MPAKKDNPRRLVSLRLPPALIARVAGRAKQLGITVTAFHERALEAALGVDTQAASSAERSSGQSHTDRHASATGAVTVRGASRLPASPPAPTAAPPAAPGTPAVADRAAAFRAAEARRAGERRVRK